MTVDTIIFNAIDFVIFLFYKYQLSGLLRTLPVMNETAVDLDNIDAVVYSWVTRILSGSKAEWYKFVKMNDSTSVPIVQAFMYYFLSHGLGYCNKDVRLALEYLDEAGQWVGEQANVEGNPYAQFILANMYAHGHAVERSAERAVEYWHRSAYMGCDLSFAHLGAAYNTGAGCKQSKVLAMYWFGQAANSEAARCRDATGPSYSQHAKSKMGILSGLLSCALRGQECALADLKSASSKVLQTTIIPLSSYTKYEISDLRVDYLLYDPIVDGLMAVLSHSDGGCHCKDLDEVAHRLSGCCAALHAAADASSGGVYCVYERGVAAFILGYMHLFSLLDVANGLSKGGRPNPVKAERDRCLAFKYFNQAVVSGEQGSGLPMADCYLGLCYLYGAGTTVEPLTGFKLVSRAADRGDVLGQYWKGLCLLYGVSPEESFGAGDYGMANLQLMWDNAQLSEQLLIEAEGTNALAFPSYKSGRRSGNSTTVSFGDRAAGLEASMHREDSVLFNSSTSRVYIHTGISLIKTSAALGFALAQNKLGELYASGVMINSLVNSTPASMFRIGTGGAHSCSPMLMQKKTPCHLWTEYVHSSAFCVGSGTDTILNRDAQEAFYWYQEASRQHCLRALLNIADCYHRGIGVKEDPTAASRYHTAAILQFQQATECA